MGVDADGAQGRLKLPASCHPDRVGGDPRGNERVSDGIPDRIPECCDEMLCRHHRCVLAFSHFCCSASYFSRFPGKSLEHAIS
jgi:hypothetical protein